MHAYFLALAAGLTLAAQKPSELLAQGRTLLDQGKAAEAVEVLTRAAEAEAAGCMHWLGRALVAAARYDEALELAEALPKGAPKGARDYVTGWALFARAKDAIARSKTQATTQGDLEDSARFLAKAVAADEREFADAVLAWAEAAWYASDLESARKAADKAVALTPNQAASWVLAGKIGFSQFVAAGGTQGGTAAEGHWQAALKAFERATELAGSPKGAAEQRDLASSWNQIGDLWSWKKDARAASAYAQALSWAPSTVNLSQVAGSMDPEAFGKLLDGAAKDFEARFGANHPDRALLMWWHAYAQFARGDWKSAEARFRGVLELAPSYVNSWYYVYRCAYAQKNYGAAVQALLAFQSADESGLLAALNGNAEENVALIDYLAGWCAGSDPEQGGEPALERAGKLNQVLVGLAPTQARYHNNLGLCLRDLAALRLRGATEEQRAELNPLFERSLAAYERALELDPEHAAYLNDTAVLLHYYLERDYPRAKSLYQKATQRAEAELAKRDIEAGWREWMQIALRDSKDNLSKLQEKMEEEAAARAKAAQGTGEGGQGAGSG
jgi:tetratricopeptide (TPR) repeat protein